MAQYLVLIYEAEAGYAEATPELWHQVKEAHTRFAEQITELGGEMLGGNALQPTQTATTAAPNSSARPARRAGRA